MVSIARKNAKNFVSAALSKDGRSSINKNTFYGNSCMVWSGMSPCLTDRGQAVFIIFPSKLSVKPTVNVVDADAGEKLPSTVMIHRQSSYAEQI